MDNFIQSARAKTGKTIAEKLELKNGKPRYGTTQYSHQDASEVEEVLVGSFEKGTNEVL